MIIDIYDIKIETNERKFITIDLKTISLSLLIFYFHVLIFIFLAT